MRACRPRSFLPGGGCAGGAGPAPQGAGPAPGSRRRRLRRPRRRRPAPGDDVDPEVDGADRLVRRAPALAAEDGENLLGEKLHLVLDLAAREPGVLEPGVEHEVLVAAVLLGAHDLVDHELHAAVQRDLLGPDLLRGDLAGEVAERLVGLGEYRAEPERPVVVPLRLQAAGRALHVADALADDVDVPAGDDAPLLVRVPA